MPKKVLAGERATMRNMKRIRVYQSSIPGEGYRGVFRKNIFDGLEIEIAFQFHERKKLHRTRKQCMEILRRAVAVASEGAII